MKEEPKVSFASLFTPNDILCHIGAYDCNEVLLALIDRLLPKLCNVTREEVLAAIWAREELQSSNIVQGLAMPHARLNVDRLVVAIATHEQGITFPHADKGPVKLILLIIAPITQPALYLQAVSSMASTCNKENAVETIVSLKSAEEIWRFFNTDEAILPEYVCAFDIMDKKIVYLNENDTLEHAVDMFVKYNLTTIPVLDAEGDMVGVVSAQELFKVCLPDYILWIDDLSPIINFEPFADMLRKEHTAWLHEIMDREYVALPEKAPAIQVVKEMTKHEVNEVFIVREKKLVGIIRSQDFISKVLRQ